MPSDVHLYIFRRDPPRGAWALARTALLHERDTPAEYRANFYEAAEVWMIEAESEQDARRTLERYEAKRP